MKSPMICLSRWSWHSSVQSSRESARSSTDSVPGSSKMAAGCEAKAKEMNWKMNISVVDSGANHFSLKKWTVAYLGSG